MITVDTEKQAVISSLDVFLKNVGSFPIFFSFHILLLLMYLLLVYAGMREMG